MDADTWPCKLHKVIGVRLYKKGDPKNIGNYRTIWLIATIMRLLERIDSSRLQMHAETNNIFQENSYGFRAGRSTMGPIFIARTLLELANQAQLPEDFNRLCLTFFDITKAYPRVPNDTSQKVFERMGVPQRMRKRLEAYDRMAVYAVKTTEGTGKEFRMSRVFRESGAASPAKFNYYHSNSIHHAMQELGEQLGEEGVDCQSMGKREMLKRSKLKEEDVDEEHIFKVLALLFADDTTDVGRERGQHEREKVIDTTLK